MSEEIYQMPLKRAITFFSMAELKSIFRQSHPAFLAAVLKAKSHLSEVTK